jgi:hypothetical protein
VLPRALASLALLAAPACVLPTQADRKPVTPQRPTVSSNTSTTAEGTWEVETGVLEDPGDAIFVPTTLKFGAGPRTEVFVGASIYERVEVPGVDAEGFGDLLVGGRHRFYESGGGSSFAGQVATKIPTGDEDEGLSTGEIDFLVAGIATQVFERLALTQYYELGVLGDPNGPGTDERHTFAFAAGHPLVGSTGAFAELAWILGRDDVDPAFTTVGITQSIAPELVVDVAFVLPLNGDAGDTLFVLGLTTNLGPLFRSVR